MRVAAVSLLFCLSFFTPLFAQETVYVAPVPQVGDPNYITFQLGHLGNILRRNQIQAAQLEALNAQAEAARAAALSMRIEDIESLLSLANLLETAGTSEQKQALQAVIQQKLQQILPATIRSYPAGTTLVFATPGFTWAAQRAAGTLAGHPVATEATYSEALEIARSNANVSGVVEIEVNVYQAFETVKANCYRRDGSLAWSEKTLLNAGGSPEDLARSMVGRLVTKIKGKKCPG